MDKVIKRKGKYFLLDLGNKHDAVSTDRLKPTHFKNTFFLYQLENYFNAPINKNDINLNKTEIPSYNDSLFNFYILGNSKGRIL